MYIILVYDVDQKRVGKMLKLCRKYLHWIQNSVFEGEITPVQLKELKYQIEEIIREQDSVIIFYTRQEKWLDKEIIGIEKNKTDNFL